MSYRLTRREIAALEMQERAQRRASSCGYQIRGRGFDGPEIRCHARRYRRCKHGFCREHHDQVQRNYPQHAHQC